MVHLSEKIVTTMATACQGISNTIKQYQSDYSPKGRHEIRRSLSWLEKAVVLQDILYGKFSIAHEHAECVAVLRDADMKEQKNETERLEAQFIRALKLFGEALLHSVPHFL